MPGNLLFSQDFMYAVQNSSTGAESNMEQQAFNGVPVTTGTAFADGFCRALYVPGAGSISVNLYNGNTATITVNASSLITTPNTNGVPSTGLIIPIAVNQVTSTTVPGTIYALY